jgi:DNA-nicking Smr family endonuclease
MARRTGKSKKMPPTLPDETDLGRVFLGGKPAPPAFTEGIKATLAGLDPDRVLEEKKGYKPRPATLKERLKAYPAPQEELDLHGSTGTEAGQRTASFINGARALKLSTVRIITGKGLHSPGSPVLPAVVETCLAELKKKGVILHYSWGTKGRDHSGAVEVYI